MGFAIKRADGTYRGWNRNAQDDTLLPGEVWEERETPPAVTPGPVPPSPPSPLAIAITRARASRSIDDILAALEEMKTRFG